MAMREALPCKQCAYDLTGLPLRGRCPECGNFYNVRTGEGVDLGPTSAHQRGDRIMARVRTIFLFSMIFIVMSCAGLLSWLADSTHGDWRKPLAFGGMVSFILLMAAVLSYFNERELR